MLDPLELWGQCTVNGPQMLPKLPGVGLLGGKELVKALLLEGTLFAPHQAMVLTLQDPHLLWTAATPKTRPHRAFAGEALGVEVWPVCGTVRAQSAGGTCLHTSSGRSGTHSSMQKWLTAPPTSAPDAAA